MLIYNDFNGLVLEKYLDFHQLSNTWIIFRKNNIDDLISYLFSEFSQDKYFVLNHESYKMMNRRLMKHNGAIILSNLNSLKTNRLISQQPNLNENIFNDLFFINNEIHYSDLKKYLYQIFNTDFGFFFKENINTDVNKIDINEVIFDIKQKNMGNISKILDLIGFFIDYDDFYYGLCILDFTLKNYYYPKAITLNLEEVQKINTNYGCKLAGNLKYFST